MNNQTTRTLAKKAAARCRTWLVEGVLGVWQVLFVTVVFELFALPTIKLQIYWQTSESFIVRLAPDLEEVAKELSVFGEGNHPSSPA